MLRLLNVSDDMRVSESATIPVLSKAAFETNLETVHILNIWNN